MEDITEKLSELLNSPGGMEKLKSTAEMLLGNGQNQTESNKNSNPAGMPGGFDLSAILGGNMPPIGDIGNIMKIMGLLKSKDDDNRTKLLLALKPHLSSDRAKRVDRAVSLIKLAGILPVLKEEGILDLLG